MKASIEEKLKIVNEIRKRHAKKSVNPDLMAKYPIEETKEMFIKTRKEDAHIYIYYPIETKEIYPLYINIHGGGFIKGHFELDELFCRKIVNKVGCIVIDIDYKVAPEFMFPYALNECYDVVKWAYENNEKLGIDKAKIAVGGHSAGGNLTAGIALMANRLKEFQIACQVLDYPPLEFYSDPATKKTFYNNPIPPEKAKMYTDMYIKEGDRINPLASPVLAQINQLRGLPPTLIITAELDSLCDEGEKYAEMLIKAGVEVTTRKFLGCTHSFTINLKGDYKDAIKTIVAFLSKVFYI